MNGRLQDRPCSSCIPFLIVNTVIPPAQQERAHQRAKLMASLRVQALHRLFTGPAPRRPNRQPAPLQQVRTSPGSARHVSARPGCQQARRAALSLCVAIVGAMAYHAEAVAPHSGLQPRDVATRLALRDVCPLPELPCYQPC